MKPTLVPCPRRWQKADGSDGGPCPACLDADDETGNAVCVDHGIVGIFVSGSGNARASNARMIPTKPETER